MENKLAFDFYPDYVVSKIVTPTPHTPPPAMSYMPPDIKSYVSIKITFSFMCS